MAHIHIRPAVANDAADLIRLIQELALYEREPQAVTNTVELMIAEGFGDKPYFEAQVAEQEGRVVGMAIYYWAYSTWRGKYLYLDDLYVEEAHRRLGIGEQLLDKVLEYAHMRGAALVKWQVLHWNEPAIAFYKKYQVVMDNEWIDCKHYFNQR
jgi:GNAT superfamily N-acetyltransferase